MPDVVRMFASLRRLSLGIGCRLSRHIQIDLAPAAAEGFLLARLAGNRWVVMLWTGLAREEHKFLGADPVCIDIHN